VNVSTQAVAKRHIEASAERLFDAWIEPAMVGTWMFGPNVREEEIVSLDADPRLGGRFSFVVRREGKLFDHAGQYLEVDRPRRLSFTWGVRPLDAESRVHVEIVPREKGCEVTVSQDLSAAWADFKPKGEEAWRRMLEALDRAVQ
jgi:uncharacterized protein YndB with AHSA1/START domain